MPTLTDDAAETRGDNTQNFDTRDYLDVHGMHVGGAVAPGSRASDGRSAPDVPASSGRAPPFALLSFGIFGGTQKTFLAEPLRSYPPAFKFANFALCTGGAHGYRLVYPIIKQLSGRRPSKGATAPQPAATLAPASTYRLLRRRPCHSHEVPIQRAPCPPTERVTTVSQVL